MERPRACAALFLASVWPPACTLKAASHVLFLRVFEPLREGLDLRSPDLPNIEGGLSSEEGSLWKGCTRPKSEGDVRPMRGWSKVICEVHKAYVTLPVGTSAMALDTIRRYCISTPLYLKRGLC